MTVPCYLVTDKQGCKFTCTCTYCNSNVLITAKLDGHWLPVTGTQSSDLDSRHIARSEVIEHVLPTSPSYPLTQLTTELTVHMHYRYDFKINSFFIIYLDQNGCPVPVTFTFE